jgi:hypothetical protein
MASKRAPSTPSRFEIAARRIDDSARAVIAAETAARQAKVKLLRKARLERDALEAVEAGPAVQKPKKPPRAKPKPS